LVAIKCHDITTTLEMLKSYTRADPGQKKGRHIIACVARDLTHRIFNLQVFFKLTKKGKMKTKKNENGNKKKKRISL